MNLFRIVFTHLKELVGKIFLISYVAGVLAALVVGLTYVQWIGSGSGQANASTYVTVTRDTITTSVKATGTVTFANEQELRFNQKGKVTDVFMKEGDHVQRGQLIAQLDTSSLQADIRQAQLSLSATSLQLQQLQSSKEKSMLDAENTLRDSERQFRDAQNALAVAQERLPSDIASAERAVAERKAAVAQAEAALEQAKIMTLQDLGSTAQSIVSQSESMLDILYGILMNSPGIHRTAQTTMFDMYYRLYNDYGLKNETERAYGDAQQSIDSMRATYGSNLSTIRQTSQLSSVLDDAHLVAQSMYTLADAMYRMTQGAIDDETDFTLQDISTMRQSIASARTTASGLLTDAEQAKAGLTGGKDGPVSIAIQQKFDALSSAQHALLAAQEQLKILQTQTPGDLQQQQESLTKIQEDYRSKQLALSLAASNNDINTRLQQNSIAQKSTTLQKTKATLEDYQLAAPFDGVIRRLDYQVGDNLLDTGEDKFVVLENPDTLVVTILLDQVDVVRVLKGMMATVAFDALPNLTFQGTINAIESTPVSTSGVVSYQVDIRLPTPPDLTILSGMTTTVQIETARRENVLTVPNLALRRANNQTTVQTGDGRTVPVETGVTDGRVTEILSGLAEGDIVLSLNIASVIQTQNANTANPSQIFRMGAGGGAGGGGRDPSFSH